MESKAIFEQLPELLIPWYHINKRDLPWRKDQDPYRIWVSEIMLQQTRVEAVKGYFHRFLQHIPTIADLAITDDEVLHKLWEGLGYYSRVRNLKKAAAQVMERHQGVFPATYDEIRDLPGIGDYTAGAICSIAFNQPTPAVDGNVLRIVSRLTNDQTPVDVPEYKKRVRDELAAVYPKEAGTFTQSLMELGATICGPNKKPDCDACPCNTICCAHHLSTADCLPVRLPKQKRREEDMTVFILRCDDRYALLKRHAKGLLAGLWQFPNTSGKLDAKDAIPFLESNGLLPKDIFTQMDRVHIFTHVRWNMRGFYVEVSEENDAFSWYSASEINREVALPTAFRQFWDIIFE